MKWTADAIPSQAGRTCIVTGANSGLGYITSLELARHGARVVMAVRNLDKGQQALTKIRATFPSALLELRELDLADLGSVEAFATRLLGESTRVDLLVNNAGVMMPPRSLTKQGFESQLGSNHLGHFALTGRLLPALSRDGRARVVNVTSEMHRQGKIHFDDLDGAISYSPTAFYSQSKLANVLFGLELDRRLRAANVPLLSVLAHPGYAATNLQSSGPTGIGKMLMAVTNRVLAQSMEMGALDQLYAATSPDLRGGELIGPDGLGALRGYPTIVQPSARGRDVEAARRLWQISEERTGVRFEFA